jgi:AraC family transcriptional regulator
MLPAVTDLAPISVSLQHATESAAPLALEELVFTTVETVVRAVGTNHTSPRRARPMTMKKMSAVFEYIDAHLGDRLDLDNLSALVALSKYHFLRSFKRECGMTPYQYILGRRLRAAAFALLATEAPVARIAFDQGFADLSTFNHTFRRVMGVAPNGYRSNRGAIYSCLRMIHFSVACPQERFLKTTTCTPGAKRSFSGHANL